MKNRLVKGPVCAINNPREGPAGRGGSLSECENNARTGRTPKLPQEGHSWGAGKEHSGLPKTKRTFNLMVGDDLNSLKHVNKGGRKMKNLQQLKIS